MTLLASLLAVGCGQEPEPGPKAAIQTFVNLWNEGSYEEMYSMLSPAAREKTDMETFTQRYRRISDGIQLVQVAIKEVSLVGAKGDRAELQYSLLFETNTVPLFELNYQLDLVQEEDWLLEWEHRHIFPHLSKDVLVRVTRTAKPRGRILDVNGVPLADNETVRRIGIVPGRFDQGNLNRVAALVNLKPETVNRMLNEGWVRDDSFVPLRALPETEYLAVEAQLQQIAGVVVRIQTGRVYNMPDSLAPTVGYVSEITAKRLEELAPWGYRAHDQVGMLGLEYYYENWLNGKFGVRIYLEDSKGSDIGTIAETAAVAGKDLQTTLDLSVQLNIDKHMDDHKGSALVLNSQSGDIVAVVSNPGFDSTLLSLDNSGSARGALTALDAPLVNRAFNGQYPPGSTFKSFTALLGLHYETLDPDEEWDTPQLWQQVTRVKRPAGPVTLATATKWSDNVFFAREGQRLGWDLFVEGCKDLGFEQDIPFVLNNQTSKLTRGSKTTFELMSLSYGQGEMLVSPLHISLMYALVARGDGLIPAPNILVGEGNQTWLQTAFTAANLNLLDQILLDTASDPKAVAWADSPGVRGKTGTAEVSSTRQLGWYSCYFDELVLTIVLEGAPPLGSRSAVAIARNIIQDIRQ